MQDRHGNHRPNGTRTQSYHPEGPERHLNSARQFLPLKCRIITLTAAGAVLRNFNFAGCFAKAKFAASCGREAIWEALERQFGEVNSLSFLSLFSSSFVTQGKLEKKKGDEKQGNPEKQGMS